MIKRYTPFLAVLICVISLSTPEKAYALSWDWIPKLWSFENFQISEEDTEKKRFECTKRNAWGNCIIYKRLSAYTEQESEY